MGREMVLHLLEEGIDVVAYNRSTEKTEALIDKIKNEESATHFLGDLTPVYSLDDLVKILKTPRIIWLMVSHGKPVSELIDQLLNLGLQKGDTIIDGGNCLYKESQANFARLNEIGINYLDVGTSGGLEGARKGACLMIGGDEEVYKKLEPLFDKLAVPGGYAYFGPSGAGHFVKMVHNGVEYGMLQALGEGFEILEKGMPASLARSHLARLDLGKVVKNWSHGSVVRGWLTELLEKAFKQDPRLDHIEGSVGGGTTGRWTIETARELNVAVPVIYESLRARETSQLKPTFAGKIVAALRNQFGGHETVKS